MKKFVVEVETLGRRQTRLVPARNENEARRNCTTAESKVISCVPYTGQKVGLSSQEETIERLFRGCLAANRRKKVPARNENEARRNCTTAESKVISCVPYTGQKVGLSSQEETIERLFRGCLAANRRKKGGC